MESTAMPARRHFEQAHSSRAPGPHAESSMDVESWLELWTVSEDREQIYGARQKAANQPQLILLQEDDLAMRDDSGDVFIHSESMESDGRAVTHSEKTLEKWEMLLRNKPRDPMAFYWREMIQWYKTRGTGARDVNDLQVAGVKRQASTSGLNLEEGVELIDRLVKKCRCSDDPADHGTTMS